MELTSLYDDLAGGGQEPTTRVRSLDKVPAHRRGGPRARGCPTATRCLAVERLRLAHGEPLAVLRNYLPADLVALDSDALERTACTV